MYFLLYIYAHNRNTYNVIYINKKKLLSKMSTTNNKVFPSIRGPLFSNDDVIILVRNKGENTIGVLGSYNVSQSQSGDDLFPLGLIPFSKNNGMIVNQENANFTPAIFTMQFFAEKPPTSPTSSQQSRDPVVFFTLSNGKDICPDPSNDNCLGSVPQANQSKYNHPGLGYSRYNLGQFGGILTSAPPYTPVFAYGNPAPFLIVTTRDKQWYPKNLSKGLILAIANSPYRFRPYILNQLRSNSIGYLNINLNQAPNFIWDPKSGNDIEYFIAPTQYYVNSSSASGNACTLLQGQEAILNVYKAFINEYGSQSQDFDVQSGFTLREDCNLGVEYPYCKLTEDRCSQTCKSTCETETAFQLVPDICVYDDGSNTFSCQEPMNGNTDEEIVGLERRTEEGTRSNQSFDDTILYVIVIFTILFLILVLYIALKWNEAYKQLE